MSTDELSAFFTDNVGKDIRSMPTPRPNMSWDDVEAMGMLLGARFDLGMGLFIKKTSVMAGDFPTHWYYFYDLDGREVNRRGEPI